MKPHLTLVKPEKPEPETDFTRACREDDGLINTYIQSTAERWGMPEDCMRNIFRAAFQCGVWYEKEQEEKRGLRTDR